MMKKYSYTRFFAVFAVAAALFCIHSCKKENPPAIVSIPKSETIAFEMKDWLLNQKQDSTAAVKLMGIAQWQNAKSILADSNVFYQIVPLTFVSSVQLEQAKGLRRYLVLLKQNGVVTDGYIYETFGDLQYLVKNEDQLISSFANKKVNDNYTGNLTKFSLTGAFREGTDYQNGMLKKYRKLITAIASDGKKIQSVDAKKSLALRCSDWWLITYYTDGTVTSDYLGRICYCDDQQQSTAVRDNKGTMSIKLSCSGDSGGGSSDPGGDGPCPPQTTQSIKNNKIVLTVSVNSCDVILIMPKIINLIKDSCLRKMVDNTINVNVSTEINTMIQEVFGAGVKVNLTFVDVTTLANGEQGYTPTSYYGTDGVLNEEIQLNVNTLPNCSQEYIAAVIMHESLHAYLDSKVVSEELQHDEIITYVNQMSSSLKRMFPNLSDADAKNLSLGGLWMTDQFKTTIANDMNLVGSYDATQLAYSIGSLGKRCN